MASGYCYKVKVPGSLMLFGEHAVLYGKTALVGAINKYITVTLVFRADDLVYIKSSALGEHRIALKKFKIEDPFKFVLAAIKRKRAGLKCGFDLLIESDFSPTVGFGSSAAVTVATLAVLEHAMSGVIPDKLDLFHEALAVVRSVQKVGSGADIAASIFGGILAYRRGSHPKLYIKKLPKLIPLTVVYSGSKVATPIVVQAVKYLRAKHLKIFDCIYDAMDKCSLEAITAIKEQDLQRLGELMNIHQGLQDAIGVNNVRLSELIFALRSRKEIKGAKISGAGLGDCVIGLGKINSKCDGYIEQIELELTANGLKSFGIKDS